MFAKRLQIKIEQAQIGVNQAVTNGNNLLDRQEVRSSNLRVLTIGKIH